MGSEKISPSAIVFFARAKHASHYLIGRFSIAKTANILGSCVFKAKIAVWMGFKRLKPLTASIEAMTPKG